MILNRVFDKTHNDYHLWFERKKSDMFSTESVFLEELDKFYY